MLKSDHALSRYKYVFVDEAHERTSSTDLLLGLLRNLLSVRDDLKIILASATLNSGMFADFFPDVPVGIENVPGRSHAVLVSYLPTPSEESLIDTTTNAIMQIHLSERLGDILVFAPGVPEIHRILDAVYAQLQGPRKPVSAQDVAPLSLWPLHSRLSRDDQEACVAALAPVSDLCNIPGRNLIVATNVAETSITLPNVTHVVDMCNVKVKVWDPRQESWSLPTRPISMAQAMQRAGRAGRVREGRAYRMCTEEAFESELSDHSPPAILRGDMLAEVLDILAMGQQPETFPFVSKPAIETLMWARATLRLLDATKDDGTISDWGKIYARLPVDLRLGVVLVMAQNYGCSGEILSVVAMLEATDGGSNLWQESREPRRSARIRASKQRFAHISGSHLTLLHVYMAWRQARNEQTEDDFCDEWEVHKTVLRSADQTRLQLLSMLTSALPTFKVVSQDPSTELYASNIIQALCTGFFMNVAKRVSGQSAAQSQTGRAKKQSQLYYSTVRHQIQVKPAPGMDTLENCPVKEREWVIYHEFHDNGPTKKFMQVTTAVTIEQLLATKSSY